MYYLGNDLGGTNIAAGVVNEQYQIIGRSKTKTPRPLAVKKKCAVSLPLLHVPLWKMQISP